MYRHSGEPSRIVALQCSVLALDRYTVFLRVHMTDTRVLPHRSSGPHFRANSEPRPRLDTARPTDGLLPSFLDVTPEPGLCARLCSRLRDSASRDGSVNSTPFGIYCRARLPGFPLGVVNTLGQLRSTVP